MSFWCVFITDRYPVLYSIQSAVSQAVYAVLSCALCRCQALPQGLVSPCDVARKSENRTKNRYANIVACKYNYNYFLLLFSITDSTVVVAFSYLSADACMESHAYCQRMYNCSCSIISLLLGGIAAATHFP